jgi:hypothetical protein
MSDRGPLLPKDDLLRLVALDADDLAIISAHAQDAVLKVRDISWLAEKEHFVLGMNRFVWEADRGGARRRREYQRRQSALHFARVKRVQSTGIDRNALEAVLELLAIRFDPTDSPSGDVVIDFAGGGAIRHSVEVIEEELTDLGPAWTTHVAQIHPA